ncbi:UNVERIFIED_CONTAM: pumilio domain member 6 [Siphonaria sp. JEL0065]|nr:pumilio domain member 6 [Siphonaria sp. JEL0065]
MAKPNTKVAKASKKAAKAVVEEVPSDSEDSAPWDDSDNVEMDQDDDEEDVDGQSDQWEGEDDEEEEGNDNEDQEEGDAEGDDDEEGSEAKKAKIKDEEKQRASRVEQKQLLAERKASKPNGALIQQLKKLWETIRQKRISTELRNEKMKELMDLITGKIQEVTFRHDAARVIQSALKHGSSAQREIIAEELKGKYATLACSQYGRFIVSKILNMCPTHRVAVLKEFQGQVRKLMRHRDAAFVIEEAYSQFANATQRNSLMEEFYGPEFALFKAEVAKPLHTIIAENPSKKAAIIKNIRETISSFLEKSAANIGPHTILHRLILDYLLLLPPPTPYAAPSGSATAATPTEAPVSSSAFMVDLLKDHLVHILHTREGARVAQLTLLHSTPKDRKYILKTFKSLVPKIAKEQFGHGVLITLCESVDDTVLVSKTILSELVKAGEGVNPGELLRDPYASRVVLYLLAGRCKRYQASYLLQELAEMDVVRKVTSKKEDEVRRKELVAALSGSWLDLCTQFVGELVRSKSGGQVLVEVLKNADGDKTTLIQAIAATTAGTMESYKAESAPIVTKPAVFNAAKKLADDAKADKEKKAAELAKDNLDEPDMAEHVLINRQATFTLKEMIAGRRVVKAGEVAEPLSETCNAVGLEIGKAIAPQFEYWLKYCAADATKTAGASFVFLALLENKDAAVVASLLGAKDKRQKKCGKLVGELEAVAEKAQAEAVVPRTVGGKRKRKEEPKAAASQGARQAAISIVLKKNLVLESLRGFNTNLYLGKEGGKELTTETPSTVEIQAISADIEENGVKLKLTVIDTPEIGGASPVVAKSDTMTEEEFKNFKVRILEDIATHKINIYSPPTYDNDDPETIQENKEIVSCIPFAVVGADRDIDVGAGRKIRGVNTHGESLRWTMKSPATL